MKEVGLLAVLRQQEEGQLCRSRCGEGIPWQSGCWAPNLGTSSRHHMRIHMPSLPFLCVQGGNDFEIYTDPRTVGHSVVSPQDTVQRCREIFFPETAHEA